KRLLDQPRVDVVAATDDQVLGAAGHPDIAVRLDPAEIAGVEPAIFGERGSIEARVEITRDEAWSADEERADLVRFAVAKDAAVIRGLDGTDLRIGAPQPARAVPDLTVARMAGQRGGVLGQPPVETDLEPGDAFQRMAHLERQGRGTGSGEAQARHVE